MDDIVDRLEQVANFKVGDIVDRFGPNEWGVTLSKLCSDAKTEIERLRNELFGLNAKLDSVRSVAGLAVAETLTYANIKKEIHNGKDSTG